MVIDERSVRNIVRDRIDIDTILMMVAIMWFVNYDTVLGNIIDNIKYLDITFSLEG